MTTITTTTTNTNTSTTTTLSFQIPTRLGVGGQARQPPCYRCYCCHCWCCACVRFMLLYLSYRIMTVLIGRLYRYVGRWVGRYIGQVTIISRRPTQEWPAFQKTSFACARTRSKGYKFQPDPLIGACGVMFRPRDKDELERGLESLEEKKKRMMMMMMWFPELVCRARAMSLRAFRESQLHDDLKVPYWYGPQ